jgi:hypothetical protein
MARRKRQPRCGLRWRRALHFTISHHPPSWNESGGGGGLVVRRQQVEGFLVTLQAETSLFGFEGRVVLRGEAGGRPARVKVPGLRRVRPGLRRPPGRAPGPRGRRAAPRRPEEAVRVAAAAGLRGPARRYGHPLRRRPEGTPVAVAPVRESVVADATLSWLEVLGYTVRRGAGRSDSLAACICRKQI